MHCIHNVLDTQYNICICMCLYAYIYMLACYGSSGSNNTCSTSSCSGSASFGEKSIFLLGR